MGQYHLIVNLDKHEYLSPHGLGNGLKLMEQLWRGDAVGNPADALFLLLAISNGRGGGDLPNGISHHFEDGEFSPKTHEPLHTLALAVIGRWGGDRIAIVGDYAEDDDLPPEHPERNASTIYERCRDSENPEEHEGPTFEDITPLVRQYLEAAGWAKFSTGDGWLDRMAPDKAADSPL